MRALVLGGGGAYGAFQAGVIRSLVKTKGRRYDLIVGTSAGALNGGFMSMVSPDKQPERADQLHAFWKGAKEGDFYKSSFLAPLFFGGFYDTKPMRKTIDKHAFAKSVTPFACTVVNASTGELSIVKSGDVPDIRPWVHASASLPVVFPPVSIEGEEYMDGGIRKNVPLEEASMLGATEIDVVTCFPNRMAPKILQEASSSLVKSAVVAMFALMEQAGEGSIDAWKKFPNVNVYTPTSTPIMNPIGFERAAIDALLAQGEKVGNLPDPI